MIRIKISYQNEAIKRVTFDGHADYDNYGQDIVCAAVSATFLCTVNGIRSFTDDIEVKIDGDRKEILVLTMDNEIIQKLLVNMLNCLISLEEQYPKNIKIDKGGRDWK